MSVLIHGNDVSIATADLSLHILCAVDLGCNHSSECKRRLAVWCQRPLLVCLRCNNSGAAVRGDGH